MNRTWSIALSIICLCGCQKVNERVGPKLFPAHGEIQIDGKAPVGATVRFTAKNGNEWGRTPIAIVREDGTFSVSFFEKDDGIPVGVYDVLVYWLDIPPGGGLPRDRLMGRFCNQSNPVSQVTIVEGSNRLAPIRLTTSAGELHP